MNITRTFRTLRHITAEQWLYRFCCRGRFLATRAFPAREHRRIAALARSVPLAALPPGPLPDAIRHVVQLQKAVHGETWQGVSAGRFCLLNRAIDFGTIEHVEWRRELGEGNNRLWRMNLGYMGYLVPLFEADAEVGLRTAKALLTGMRAQNSWKDKGVFRDIWHPYTVSHRVINLLTCLYFIDPLQAERDPEATALMLDEIRFGTAFVLAHLERDLQYNHLMKNYVCLSLVAAVTGQPETLVRPLSGVKRAVARQYLADGCHSERAPMYHLLAHLDLRILRQSEALPPGVRAFFSALIDKSENAAVAMIHPDGDVSLFNDSWLGEAPKAASMIDGLVLASPEPRVFDLPHAGYVRLCHDRDSVVFDYGACGPDDNPGHAHADFLSLELSAVGLRTLVDPGVPTYSQGRARDISRSAGWHNGPAFGGAEPLEYWSSFRAGRRGYAYRLPLAGELVFAGWQDGYAHIGGTAARALQLIPGKGLLIVDLWHGARERAASSRFLIAPEWHPNADGSFSGGAATLRLQLLEGTVGGTEPAPYWEKFGVERQATAVTIAPADAGDLRMAGLWIAWGGGGMPIDDAWSSLRQGLIAAFRARKTIPGRGRGAA